MKFITTVFLLIISVAAVAVGQDAILSHNVFSALSHNSSVYYIIREIDEQGEKFSLYSVRPEKLTSPFFLNSYLGNPLVNTVHDGNMTAFFANGTAINYSRSSSRTMPGLDKGLKPVDAVSAAGNLYLLAQSESDYQLHVLKRGNWELASIDSLKLPEGFNNGQLFYYNGQIYIAGQDGQGKIFCDGVFNLETNSLRQLDITIDSKIINSHIVDIITANRTVMFILTDDKQSYYASPYINDQLISSVELQVNDMPELANGMYSFFSIDTDIALAVYSENKVYLRKYKPTGTIIGDIAVSYDLKVLDVADNIYIEIISLAFPVIVLITIIFRFKKVMAAGVVPKTSFGIPSPVTLRVPAFVVDVICLTLIMDLIIAIFGFANLFDRQELDELMAQVREQVNTGVISVDMGPILSIMAMFYVIMMLYFVLFEWLMSATPGKMLFGLKVVDSLTLIPYKIAFWRILIRNIYRFMEIMPFTIPVVLIAMIISPRRQRPGDMVANTTVVLVRPVKKNGTNIDHQA